VRIALTGLEAQVDEALRRIDALVAQRT